jgi:large subunit ribosomal protein L13
MKTFSATPNDIQHDWWVIDAKNLVTGRLAAKVATLLRGKHKPIYTPHMDCGDHVIVVNADKIRFTGRKMSDKKYYRHTGFPGGIKETDPETVLRGDHPERVLNMAIRRMVPKGPLGRKQLRKLHVYTGETHPHEAQKPQVLNFADANPKNKRND